MSSVILHHYPLSTFSEKVRLALGFKGLAYGSVDIAPMPPRPLLNALTGGYRKVPVLQVGADIYCDTQLILPALERLHPSPTLYPPGSAGLADAISFAWGRFMWKPTIGVLVHYIGEHLPMEFIKDRKEGYLGYDISKAAMAPDLPLYRQQVQAHCAYLKAALADGRKFLFGDMPSAADLSCFQTLFLLRKNSPPEVDDFVGLQALLPWYDRINAIGHGRPSAMTPEQAFEAARDAEPAPVTHLRADGDPGGLPAGAKVTVTPDDNARVPVSGTLVAAGADEIVIHRHDPQAGNLHIHFPRIGFDVLPA
jgi:glutathione S-transferase